ncbi:MAG: ArsA family ATPase [Acidobacteria bacterium]|nr:ArsA family ATPase [Acidobacteriota bacterium]
MSSEPRPEPAGEAGSLLERLASLQLIVVTGKGGVGKTLITATLGRLLAFRGRTVLLMELDPRESLHHLLDVAPSGGEIVPAGSGLFLQNLQPRQVLDELVHERLKVGALSRRVLGSPIYQQFAEGAPGLKETGVLGRTLRLVDGHGPRVLRRPDAIILDAPATGHGVSLLRAPSLVAEVVRSGPVGHLARQIAAFVADSQRTGIVLVTSAEEMPIQETVELVQDLDSTLGRRPELVIANALYPPYSDARKPTRQSPALELWKHRRRINENQLARLGREWGGPLARVPLLPIDGGPQLLEAAELELRTALRAATSGAE